MTSQLICLPEVDSTNRYAKAEFARFQDLQAVYTTSQTAGRGRLGTQWENASGQGLYFTLVLKQPMAQPASLPLLASLVVADALQAQFGMDCQVKWPNDLLCQGRKICGILCEGVAGGLVCGIGINLAQPAVFFEQAGLPHAGSVYAQTGVCPPMETAPHQLASALQAGFAQRMPAFAQQGFAGIRAEYLTRCINLGKTVWFEGGHGTASDIDPEGRLVVQTQQGTTAVFTGEVRVTGIYGA